MLVSFALRSLCSFSARQRLIGDRSARFQFPLVTLLRFALSTKIELCLPAQVRAALSAQAH